MVAVPAVDLNNADPQHRSRKNDDPEPVDPDRIEAALDVISSDCPYEVWRNVGGALHRELGEHGFELFDQWSAKAKNEYNAGECRERWRGVRSMTEISAASIFRYADQADPTWRERYDHDRQERIIDRLADDIGASRAGANQTPPDAAPPTAAPQKAAPAALHWLNMSNWDNEPVPERQWAIRDRVPLNQVGLFSGEGGTGKSIIELMKNVAHVMGLDWLGSLPELGPAFYIGTEDEADELHIRLAMIAKHYRVSFEELVKGGLHVLPLLGEDATLCALNPRTGRVETTALYRQIFEAAGDLHPKNISIDTLSRAFAGDEINRVQVYAFATYMQALAKVASGSVTVLSHPSLAGMSSGSGISGSTAWHGAFRFRQYLKGVKTGDGEQPDNNLRELEFKKNQYGPLGETIALRYQNGLFLPLASASGLDKLAHETRAETAFMDLLRRLSGQGRNVSHKKTSNNYAPTAFAAEPEAKKHQLRKSDFEEAMRRLFAADRIMAEGYGRPSQPLSRIIEKPPEEGKSE